MANKTIINCDLGECLTPNPDTLLMPLIDMANIACGGHIGNDKSMTQTLQLALKNNVIIAAHPSYADRQNFGRISHYSNPQALFDLVYQQVSHFQHLCQAHNAKLQCLKPHGALYHDMVNNPAVFKTLCQVIDALDGRLSLVVPNGFKAKTSIQLLSEMFADRLYKNGKILPRSMANSVLDNVDKILRQYDDFLSINDCQTICFHSDNPASVEALKQIINN